MKRLEEVATETAKAEVSVKDLIADRIDNEEKLVILSSSQHQCPTRDDKNCSTSVAWRGFVDTSASI